MGRCRPGYRTIHSLLQSDLSDCAIKHDCIAENQLWNLAFLLKPGYERKVDEFEIGRIKNISKTIRLSKEHTWWVSTRQNDGVSLPRDQDTLLLLAMIETNTPRSTKYVQYLCFLPLVNYEIVGTLRGDRDIILVRFEHESFAWATGNILISMGPKPIDLLKSTVAYQQSLSPPPSKPIPLPYPEFSSELYSGKLTYCTWNSLQRPTPTTATSMIKALKSFPLAPNNLLIDDGWQTTVNARMSEYGAQPYWLDGYNNLGDVISYVKSLGVERVGVWHTVLGYWGGVSRTSETFKHLPFLTLRKNWGAQYDVIHPFQVDKFFDAWYKQLSDWGVDFVKCDDMAEIEDMDSCIDDEGNTYGLRAFRTAYVLALKRNIEKHFSGRNIWCMSHSPRHLIGPYSLSHSKEIKPMRSSNDYFPNIPSSHAYHIYTNVVASQFLSCFSIADFDMFQTHESLESSSASSGRQGPFHASLRALGNGPVTVTDVPGHCDSTVFMCLAGQTRDGKTIALNGNSPLGLMNERFFDEVMHGGDGKGLHGYCKSGWGVMMGIWNVREGGGSVKDTISMTDFTGVLEAQEVVCWSHAHQEVFFLKSDSKRTISLKELEFEILTVVAMSEEIVCLGLVDKYNTLAAIQTHEGNTWTFKCLGQAVWVIPGHRRVKIKVEETEVSTRFWTMEDMTVVKAGLKDYSETASVSEQFWAVKVEFY